MPAEFDSCVNDLKKQGKSNDSAYAICVSSYQKKHGKSPFSKKEEIQILPISTRQRGLFVALFEAEQSGRKVKLLEEEVTGKVVSASNDNA